MRLRTTAISLYLVLFLLASDHARAQDPRSASIGRQQAEEFGRLHLEREQQWDSVNAARLPGSAPKATLKRGGAANGLARSNDAPVSSTRAADTCRLNGRVVFGWHPYWSGTAYTTYDFSLLSDICYFAYDVDPATGSYTSVHSWKTTDLVPLAKKAGVRVHLCATLFSDHASLLGVAANRSRLIDSLIALVRLRDGDGVNIDFEAVPASQRANLTAFMRELGERFHAQIPGGLVSIALPAVDWGDVFDVAAMRGSVDLFIIMGYDYHWSSAPNAGPVAPKNSGRLWSPYDATRSVNAYLAEGIAPEKLCLGVPHYGYDWPTADSTIGAATIGSGTAVLYASARIRAAERGRRWEPQSSTPYYIYRVDSVSTWRQCWYDDAESLRMKYEMVNARRLAGVGIWALGYDAGTGELWDVLRDAFTNCAAAPCSSTVADLGGPGGDYFNNDRYTMTIAPRDAHTVTLSFYSFSVADDELALYDGRDTLGTLLGRYSGTSSPGTITARSGAITLSFRSNAATTSWGWVANWTCSTAPLGAPMRAGRAAPDAPAVAGLAAYPNPTNGTTTIVYQLAVGRRVRISVADMRGREVAVLHQANEAAGHHSVELDPRAHALAAGTYLVRAQAGASQAAVKVTIR